LNALAPYDAVVGVEHDFSAVGAAGFLNCHCNSRASHQFERDGHILSPEAHDSAVRFLEHGCAPEDLGLEIRDAAPE
jgi:hypothetical protein